MFCHKKNHRTIRKYLKFQLLFFKTKAYLKQPSWHFIQHDFTLQLLSIMLKTSVEIFCQCPSVFPQNIQLSEVLRSNTGAYTLILILSSIAIMVWKTCSFSILDCLWWLGNVVLWHSWASGYNIPSYKVLHLKWSNENVLRMWFFKRQVPELGQDEFLFLPSVHCFVSCVPFY